MGPRGRLLVSALLIALTAVPLAGAALPALPPPTGVPQSGPDVPTASAPVAVLTPIDRETWSYDGGWRVRAIDVPAVPWNRVVVAFTGYADTDPWDRLFIVTIGEAEVFRGTTPRTDFTVRKDVTAFASLLPPGEASTVGLSYGTYEGAARTTVSLEFYDDATGVAFAPADAVVAPWLMGGIWAPGEYARAAAFPASAPSAATLEFTTTGHGQRGEFWFQYAPTRPRVFHVLVDGTEVATVRPLPYLYAFQGYRGSTGTLLHPVMWWTAQQALDVAGVHGGVGEIPPYRVEILPEHLPLLAGARDVTVVAEGVSSAESVWITSATFLLRA